jgi:ketosteroid isomerase-like protein
MAWPARSLNHAQKGESAMAEQENIRLVQELYAAFGGGDVPAMLNGLAPDVDWSFNGPTKIPFGGSWRGPEGVAKFFAALAENLQPVAFAPEEYIAQGNKVAALGHEHMRIKSTGLAYETAWAHVFTFREGKITAFREYSDSAAIMRAFKF